MKPTQFAALLGFLFVAVWATQNFANAILCLIGAAIFYLAYALYQGELNLDDLQQRMSPNRRP
jgi:uncharacterized membrane protein (Fun14 family)